MATTVTDPTFGPIAPPQARSADSGGGWAEWSWNARFRILRCGRELEKTRRRPGGASGGSSWSAPLVPRWGRRLPGGGSSGHPDCASADPESRVPSDRRSGSVYVDGLRAQVARASRIWVEGIHDAELIEQVWGHDLRVEAVVVEPLHGADDLLRALREFGPGPQRRVGCCSITWSRAARSRDWLLKRDYLSSPARKSSDIRSWTSGRR